MPSTEQAVKSFIDWAGVLRWLPTSFGELSDDEISRTGLCRESANHPFLVVKTYGADASLVMGCVCSKSYLVPFDSVPIIDSTGGSCHRCISYPEGVQFPNPKRLRFRDKDVGLSEHTHVKFATFAIIKSDLLLALRYYQKPDYHRLSPKSLAWILTVFADKISKAEESSKEFLQLPTKIPKSLLPNSIPFESEDLYESCLRALRWIFQEDGEDDTISEGWAAMQVDADWQDSCVVV